MCKHWTPYLLQQQEIFMGKMIRAIQNLNCRVRLLVLVSRLYLINYLVLLVSFEILSNQDMDAHGTQFRYTMASAYNFSS